MSPTPRISIGVPVYNGEQHLEEALNALINQTFTDFEIIISDNCSTDSTEHICREFELRDSRIRYVRQSKNEGALANFVFVLKEAQADHFMWAAHDDVFDKDWIDSLLPLSIKNNCIAFGQVQTIDEKGRKTFHVANNRDLSFRGPRLLRRLRYATDPGFPGKANPVYGVFPTAALTKEALTAFGTNDMEGDVMMMFYLLDRYEIMSISGTHLFKRQSPAAGPMPSAAKPKRQSMRDRTMLDGFLRYSRGHENILLRLLYPFTLLRYRIANLHLRRLARRKITNAGRLVP
ncbi:glycosyltransferase family 2 protein [Hoeflea sp.]|uniref:glycosyltransferase family 2 protein n=1 Tax=Hoeflea sp. TaxID=1940281 RepID=UPI003B51BABA